MTKQHPFAVAVLTPSTGSCRIEYAQSLARLCMYFAQVQIFEGQPLQYLITDAVSGSGIAENYENMVKKYLEDTRIHWTHFLSVEDDMAFPPNALHTLARRRLPIVGANYSTNKGSPQRFTASGAKSRIITSEESTGVEEAMLLPQGLTLVAREVYEKLPHPWFLMGYNQASGNYIYQDWYFSEQARKHGYKLYVDHDVSKEMVHVGPKNYTWRDVLCPENLYPQVLCNGSDISAHCEHLRRLASKVSHVTELGTREGNSTISLLAGRPKTLVTIDKDTCRTEAIIRASCNGTNLSFVKADSRKCRIAPTDLLFIDTKHTARQLTAELTRHAPQVARYIALHDTVSYGDVGEDGKPGLLHAVQRWLKRHPEWTVELNDRNQNGLMILARKPEGESRNGNPTRSVSHGRKRQPAKPRHRVHR